MIAQFIYLLTFHSLKTFLALRFFRQIFLKSREIQQSLKIMRMEKSRELCFAKTFANRAFQKYFDHIATDIDRPSEFHHLTQSVKLSQTRFRDFH